MNWNKLNSKWLLRLGLLDLGLLGLGLMLAVGLSRGEAGTGQVIQELKQVADTWKATLVYIAAAMAVGAIIFAVFEALTHHMTAAFIGLLGALFMGVVAMKAETILNTVAGGNAAAAVLWPPPSPTVVLNLVWAFGRQLAGLSLLAEGIRRGRARRSARRV